MEDKYLNNFDNYKIFVELFVTQDHIFFNIALSSS